MMQHGSFISLAEAVALTGVSASTLSRFAEAGYFGTRPMAGNENEFELNHDEICTLFKIISKPNAKSVSPEIAAPTAVHFEQEVPAEAEKSSLASNIEINGTNSVVDETKVAPTVEIENVELQKLRALCELHEKYIEFKDSQVASLTEERNWLRTRIEKLEEKAERDQVIMASMSETQRGLVTQIGQKKSALQSALQWFGVTQPEPQRDDSRL